MGCRLAVSAAASILSLVVIGPTSSRAAAPCAPLVRRSVIIPTITKPKRLGRVLADLPSHLTTEVIVVDISSGQKAYASLTFHRHL